MHGQIVGNIIVKKMSVHHGVHNVKKIDGPKAQNIEIAITPVIVFPVG
jgi:hypothetical protein